MSKSYKLMLTLDIILSDPDIIRHKTAYFCIVLMLRPDIILGLLHNIIPIRSSVTGVVCHQRLAMSTPDFSQKCVLKCSKQCYYVVHNVV